MKRNILERLLRKFRKHKFDLNNPWVVDTGGIPRDKCVYKIDDTIKYKVYICKNCGYRLGLSLWQMKQLPWEMARNCSDKFITKKGGKLCLLENF